MRTVMRYKKKPVVIEAIQFSRENWDEVMGFVFVGDLKGKCPLKDSLYEQLSVLENDATKRISFPIPTLEGIMLAMEHDWIIRGIKGEFYPCKPDIFEVTYELV